MFITLLDSVLLKKIPPFPIFLSIPAGLVSLRQMRPASPASIINIKPTRSGPRGLIVVQVWSLERIPKSVKRFSEKMRAKAKRLERRSDSIEIETRLMSN